MRFSGALTLTDLNDFITPSQACIKPVESSAKDSRDGAAPSTEIRIDPSGAYYEIQPEPSSPPVRQKLQKAQVNLNDCLACSGCITSAESVLITIQSHTEVLNFLSSNPGDPSDPSHKRPVLSIAPQCLAALAASLSASASPSLRQVLRRVQAFCRTSLGIAHVYDTTFARHVSLLEHSREFAERKHGGSRLPMLASACPGWVCYAEKTQHEMLPFISRTRSPQQLMGVLVKSWMGGTKWDLPPDRIYHISVMPCYDKKLEASRQEFYNDLYATRDVDCVITTGELEVMMRERGWDLSVPVDGEDCPFTNVDGDGELPELVSHPGTSSGSYLHTLLDAVVAGSPAPLELSVRTVRTADYEEYTLSGGGAVVFKGAKCYGFRNLQNVVRKVGREAGVQVGRGAAGKMAGGLRARRAVGGGGGDGEKGYDYVEVMACPGGCVNGGGQVRPSRSSGGDDDGVRNAKWGDKEWMKKVEEAYWDNDTTSGGEEADRMAVRVLVELCRPKEVIGDWCASMDEEAEERRRALFRTEYRAVESEVVGLAVQW